MKELVVVAAFFAVCWYVLKKTAAPTVVQSATNLAPSVGPTDGGNTYPGMAGATYTPKPGYPGQLMPVVNSTFVPSQGSS